MLNGKPDKLDFDFRVEYSPAASATRTAKEEFAWFITDLSCHRRWMNDHDKAIADKIFDRLINIHASFKGADVGKAVHKILQRITRFSFCMMKVWDETKETL